MKRRYFLAMAGTIVFGTMARTEASPRQISADGVTFEWHHKNGRLFGTLSAPTSGWIAVGFNNQEKLSGTRFVIAAVSQNDVHAEEHIAVVPNHPKVQDMGLAPGLSDLLGALQIGQSKLWFSLPHRFSDTENPVLEPGHKTFLMLAWSRAPEFDHHSAWRKHFPVIL